MGFNKHSVGTTGRTDTHFASTVHSDIQKSRFNRDQVVKTTFNAGRLVPVYIDEVLPGDVHEVDLAYIARLQTPVFPTMDSIELDWYFFFVPNRIVWDGWQSLNGENTSSAWVPNVEPALCPVIDDGVAPHNVVTAGSIFDYYGIPIGYDFQAYNNDINSLPFRGYTAIWNRWFRDQNLQAPIALSLGNSADNPANYNQVPYLVNKKHDYFTSALPQSLKPVSDTSTPPRLFSIMARNWNFDSSSPNFQRLLSTYGSYTTPGTADTATEENFVQAFRTATQLTKLLERDARGGTRYIEMLKAHFGVEAEDYRLQYPEFLGHYSTTMGISQVPQTSSTDTTSPQGNLSAYGMTAGKTSLFNKSFVEHGYIHGFCVARQRKTYQQGVERFWYRRDRFDYYYPELAHITEQPIYCREIFADGSQNDNDVFGIQEAWADYRYKPNRVCAQFRSNHPSTLAPWHYADWYTSRPVLSDAWIKDNSEANINRTLAVDSSKANQFLLDLKVGNKTSRPMPVYSIPGFMDHF